MSELRETFYEVERSVADPLSVLKSTKPIVEHSELVFIDLETIYPFAQKVKKSVESGELLNSGQFGQYQVSIEKVWWIDNLNFCFWAEHGQTKWEIAFPNGIRKGGWRGLVAAFDKALSSSIPITDTHFLKGISLEETKEILKGEDGSNLPLIEKRHQNLVEAATILQRQYGGDIRNLLEEAEYDAVKIAQLLIRDFPSFQDYIETDSGRVFFLKRAQIFPYDLSLLPQVKITNLEQLTVFPDYRLPQLLRESGILRYDQRLAERIDGMEVLEQGSREELEIRANTLWACQLIANAIGESAVTVDNALWLMANRLGDRNGGMEHPHHRVYTHFY